VRAKIEDPPQRITRRGRATDTKKKRIESKRQIHQGENVGLFLFSSAFSRQGGDVSRWEVGGNLENPKKPNGRLRICVLHT
jgi:hypothetical protein